MPIESIIRKICLSSGTKKKLYTQLNKDLAECELCKATFERNCQVKTKDGNTKGLTFHLKTRHKNSEECKQYLQMERDKDEQQSGLDSFLKINSGGGLSAADKRVINYICENLHSFASLNTPSTKSVFKDALKDASYYRKIALKKAYDLVKAIIVKKLDEAEWISFTTDIWSGPKDSFICLTAHYVDKKWNRNAFVLSVSEFSGSHTGYRIGEKIRDILKDWRIDAKKCHLFLRDGGANMKKAFEDTEEFEHADCAAHLLNLVVKDGLKHPPIIMLLAKCRRIVAHFKHSNLAKDEFKCIQLEQNLPEHMLLQEMPVRWNSAYTMCRRLNEQHPAVSNYAFRKERHELDLTDAEWAVLEEIVQLLGPLDELTRLFCESSIAVQFSFAMLTKKALQERVFRKTEVGTVKARIVQGLEERFGNLFVKREIAVAQFMDPRIKDRNAELPEVFQAKILSWLEELNGREEMTELVEVENELFRPPSPKRQHTGLLATFEESMTNIEASAGPSHAQSQPDLRNEFAEYVVMARAPMSSDPLVFWRDNAEKFPVLAKAARRFLSAPATSVCSEQAFSTARDVFTYRRMNEN